MVQPLVDRTQAQLSRARGKGSKAKRKADSSLSSSTVEVYVSRVSWLLAICMSATARSVQARGLRATKGSLGAADGWEKQSRCSWLL